MPKTKAEIVEIKDDQIEDQMIKAYREGIEAIEDRLDREESTVKHNTSGTI